MAMISFASPVQEYVWIKARQVQNIFLADVISVGALGGELQALVEQGMVLDGLSVALIEGQARREELMNAIRAVAVMTLSDPYSGRLKWHESFYGEFASKYTQAVEELVPMIDKWFSECDAASAPENS